MILSLRIFALLSVLIILATILTYRLGLKENDLLIPLLVLCFLCFHFSLNAPLVKTLTVYAAVLALLSILTIYAACYDASVSPSSGIGTFTLSLPLAQLAVTVLAASLLAYPFARYGKFLIEQPFSSWAWAAIILFLLTIIVTNIAIYPIVYFLFKEDLATLNVVLMVTAQLIVWILMLVILYSVISDTLAMSNLYSFIPLCPEEHKRSGITGTHSVKIGIPVTPRHPAFRQGVADYDMRRRPGSSGCRTEFYSANNGVERYLSPVSGKRATIVLPLFSGRFAS